MVTISVVVPPVVSVGIGNLGIVWLIDITIIVGCVGGCGSVKAWGGKLCRIVNAGRKAYGDTVFAVKSAGESVGGYDVCSGWCRGRGRK